MARKKKHEEHENLERWLVSYADFITLLFAFFVVLYALGQTEKREYKDAIISIQRAFLSGGGIFPLKGYPLTPFESAPDHGTFVPTNPEDIGKYGKSSKAKVEELERVQKKIKGLFTKSTGLSLQETDLEVVPSKEGFRIRLNEKLLFSPGSAKIKRRNVPFLYEIGKRLGKLGFEIQVEGHTDGTGNRQENWELSTKRAYNVMQFLVEGALFPQNKISMAGYGNTRPLSINGATAMGKSQNRRVEIAVMADKNEIKNLPW